MFSYARGKAAPIIDAGSFTGLTVAMLHFNWSPIALTQNGEFHAARYFGFLMPWDKVDATSESLTEQARPHILAKSQSDDLILILPSTEHFTEKEQYLAALEKKLTFPTLKGAAPILDMQRKIKKLVSFKLEKRVERLDRIGTVR